MRPWSQNICPMMVDASRKRARLSGTHPAKTNPPHDVPAAARAGSFFWASLAHRTACWPSQGGQRGHDSIRRGGCARRRKYADGVGRMGHRSQELLQTSGRSGPIAALAAPVKDDRARRGSELLRDECRRSGRAAGCCRFSGRWWSPAAAGRRACFAARRAFPVR